jgi:hypothetical protein
MTALEVPPRFRTCTGFDPSRLGTMRWQIRHSSSVVRICFYLICFYLSFVTSHPYKYIYMRLIALAAVFLARVGMVFLASDVDPLSPSMEGSRPVLGNCARVGPMEFRWELQGNVIEFQIEAAVEDPQGSWLGIGFTDDPSGSMTVQMAPSNVVISGFVGSDAFSSSYELTQRSSSGVNPSGPDVELIMASVGEDGVMSVRASRPLGSWPVDGSSAVIWASGRVRGTAEAPFVMYHGSSRVPSGTTGTVVLAAAQNTC